MKELVEIRYVDWTRKEITALYLVTQRIESGEFLSPVRLGRGRFAQVIMATTSSVIEPGMKFFALKFLTNDDQSHAFSRNARSRYFGEVVENSRLRLFGGKGIVFFCGAARMFKKLSPYAASATTSSAEELADFGQEATFNSEFGEASARINQAAEFNDEQSKRLDPSFLKQIQGEFFVMEAAEGSLEDFLIDWRPWSGRKCFQVDPSLASRLQQEREGSEERLRRFMEELGNRKSLDVLNTTDRARLADPYRARTIGELPGFSRSDCSGMSILQRIASNSPALRDHIVVGLWKKAAQAVSHVHAQVLDTDVPLAHRDLKFGNFLFSPFHDDQNLVLTDLGFVAPNTKRGGTMDFSSPREVGMVALGSRLFRGPEQRDALPPPEVRFRVLSKNKVEFFNFGDTDIQVGDRLESPDQFFCEFMPSFTTSIVSIEARRGRVIATLEDDVRHWRQRRGDEDFLGFILKLSGQHSDIFALGAFLYFLASGGNDPESFYDACLRNVIDPDAQKSCLSLALSLCVDSPTAIAADLDSYRDRASPLQKNPGLLEEAASKVRSSILGTAPQGVVANLIDAIRGRDQESDVGRGIRFWRENPTVQRFMRDRNGVAIPFPIVYETVRCMVRDRVDSYVARTRADEPLCNIDCRNVTADMVKRSEVLCTLAPSIQVNLSKYATGSPLQFFVMLRIALPIAGFESSVDEALEEEDDGESAIIAESASRAISKAKDAAGDAAPEGEVDRAEPTYLVKPVAPDKKTLLDGIPSPPTGDSIPTEIADRKRGRIDE